MATAKIRADSAGLDLIEHPNIGLDLHRPGRHRARLVEENLPIWPLIAFLQGDGAGVASTAVAYAISEEAVKAAVAYYEADPRYIDAFLLLN